MVNPMGTSMRIVVVFSPCLNAGMSRATFPFFSLRATWIMPQDFLPAAPQSLPGAALNCQAPWVAAVSVAGGAAPDSLADLFVRWPV
jgi:hypothetical protein